MDPDGPGGVRTGGRRGRVRVARGGAASRLVEETEALAARDSVGGAGRALGRRGTLLPPPRRDALASRLPAAEQAYRALAGDADLERAVRSSASAEGPLIAFRARCRPST